MDSHKIKAARILLIEDEPIIAKLLQTRLKKSGYEVEIARDGIIGLEKIKQAPPDLVLLDMMLPRLNGFGVLEKLTELGILPKLPIIVISNSGQPVEIDQALKLGVRDYLVKVDFEPEELLEKIERFFAAGTVAVNEKNEPVQDAHPPPPPPASDSAAPADYKGSVLFVEDDALLGDLLGRKLTQRGYRIIRAGDAAAARNALASERVDVLLLDIILPGMDGVSFLEEISQSLSQKNIPVIMLSNLSQKETLERSMRAGAADFIVKANVSLDEITKKVEEQLAKRAIASARN